MGTWEHREHREILEGNKGTRTPPGRPSLIQARRRYFYFIICQSNILCGIWMVLDPFWTIFWEVSHANKLLDKLFSMNFTGFSYRCV